MTKWMQCRLVDSRIGQDNPTPTPRRGTKGRHTMQQTLPSASLISLEKPARLTATETVEEDRAYQTMTVVAILVVLGSVWVF